MSEFCPNCGTATGGGKFCPKCGAPQAVDAGTPSMSQAPYAPVKKKSSVWKIVLITLAVLFAILIAGAVKGYYFIKDRVQEVKQEMANEKTGPAQPTQAGCDLLSKEKVADIIGAPVGGSKGNKPGALLEQCSYYTQPVNDTDADNSDPKDFQAIARKISADASHPSLLSVQIYRGNAAGPVIAIKTVGRLAGNAEPNVPGPWDEAYFGPANQTLAVRKGENGFVLSLTRVANKREAGLELAKAMVAGLD